MEMSDNQNDTGADVIPAEDFRTAIEVCCRLPRFKRYYEEAPNGARMYIALQFYARVFASHLDEEQYRTCRLEIEPDLTLHDLDYLLQGETDAASRSYLEALRERLVAHQPPAVPSQAFVSTRKLKPLRRLRRVEEMRTKPVDDVPDIPDDIPDLPPETRVLSEYEQQCRAARRERLKEGLLKVFGVLLALAACGAVWYFQGERIRRLFTSATAPSDTVAAKGDDAGADVPSVREPGRKAERVEARAERERAQQKIRSEAEARRAQEAEARRKKVEADRLQAERARTLRKEYNERVQAFKRANYGFWRDAPKSDRPAGVAAETTFQCLVPKSDAAYDIYELTVAPGAPMKVVRLLPDRPSESVASEAFTREAASKPHILMKGTNAYLGAAKGRGSDRSRIGVREDVFNPFREEFGALYEVVRRLGVGRLPLAYEVVFQLKGENAEIPVETVFFGREVPYSTFREKVADWMAQRTAKTATRRKAKTARKRQTVILADIPVVRKRLDGVTEVPRTFVYASSNKHKYFYDSRAYASEARKEEIARAKWQQLYNEAVRQEQAVAEAMRAPDADAYRPSASQLEEALRTGTLIYRMKKN